MPPTYVIRRLNLRNYSSQWWSLVENRTVVWNAYEKNATQFAQPKVAQKIRSRLAQRHDTSKWRVSVRAFGQKDVVIKPNLSYVDWSQTNVTLGKHYGVHPTTIANWRTRARRPPAPHGGSRPNAGRTPK